MRLTRFAIVSLLLVVGLGSGVLFAGHPAQPTVPASGTITASGPTSFAFDAPARAGAATGPGDCGLIPNNCSAFLLTVQTPGGKNVRVRLDWTNVANDYDMNIFKQGPGLSETQVANSGNGTTTFEEAVFTPEANTTYQIVIVHFAATGVGAAGPENIHGVASLVDPPTVVNPSRIGPAGTGIVFSPNGNMMTSAGEAPTGRGTVMAPETVRDGEPSLRADVRGNVYPAGIRGVPAGVDVWRFGPNAFCPRFTFHDDDEPALAGGDPPSSPNNPAAGYVYLGQPDGIFVTEGEGSPDAGGGDIEITTSFPGDAITTPTLSMVSLTLANITSAASFDRGNNWTPAHPVAATVPLDDRQWIESYGPNTVYLYYRTLATLTGLVLNKSIDGGVTYAASTNIVNPLGFTPGWIDVDQTPNSLDGSVDIYLSAQNSAELVVFHCVDPTPSLPSVISCTPSTVDRTMSHGHIFDVVSVDNADRVYAAWSNNKDIFYAYSTNKGGTWSSPVKVTNAGAGGGMPNFNFFPWITAGDDGRVGIVWYGTDKTSNADNNAEWKAYYAFTANARAATPTVRWLAASDHVIHKSNVSQAGLSTDEAVNRNLIDFFQVAHDPRDGAAVIAFADDHNDFDGATYYTRQIAGPGLRKNKTPTQPFCPPLPPLRNPEVIDRPNDEGGSFAAGAVPDADILSVDYGSQTTGGNLFLTAALRVSLIPPVAPPARSYRAYFAVNTQRGLMDAGNEYFLEVTTESGAPQFFLGVTDRRADGTTHERRLTQAQENITADNPGSPFVAGSPGVVKLRVNVNRLNWSFVADGTPGKGGSSAPALGSLVIGLRGRTRLGTPVASSTVDTTRGGSFIILGRADDGGGAPPGMDDDDDFDNDGTRDDIDKDDDNDGVNDDQDPDDDNDGISDAQDADDDNDSILDIFDNQSTRELQDLDTRETASGEATQYAMVADANTVLLTASAVAFDVDPLTQPLAVDIYNPLGALVATSLSTPGRATATTVPALTGTYIVRVRNTGLDAVIHNTTLVRSQKWF